ncbi:hypothetical protein J4Q44_G00150570 [Coregonus suidteri]|uniref:CCHC-type domain-containing protein n=1 Tax=Coregonus suidteri TaxID=861788 RepID=A0AAN8QYJ7_9TELE
MTRDLWMLLAFLRLKAFNRPVTEGDRTGLQNLQRPVTEGDRTGLQNLQALVKCITLCRMNTSRVCGQPLVSLTQRSVSIEEAGLTQERQYRREPMQVGRISQAERDRRMRERCCLYCGKPGHFRSTCPGLQGNALSRAGLGGL